MALELGGAYLQVHHRPGNESTVSSEAKTRGRERVSFLRRGRERDLDHLQEDHLGLRNTSTRSTHVSVDQLVSGLDWMGNLREGAMKVLRVLLLRRTFEEDADLCHTCSQLGSSSVCVLSALP